MQRSLVENIPAKVVLPPTQPLPGACAMESIPQSVIPATPDGTRGISCNSHVQGQEPFEPDRELVRQFVGDAKRQIVTGDYLRRKWLPLYGPRFYSLIKALRGHCSYEIKTGEAMCYP